MLAPAIGQPAEDGAATADWPADDAALVATIIRQAEAAPVAAIDCPADEPVVQGPKIRSNHISNFVQHKS